MLRFVQSSIYGIAFMCLGLLLVVSNVHAQNDIAVRIQPSEIHEQTDPGGMVTGSLTITNESGGRQEYYLHTRDITDVDINNRPSFSSSTSNNSSDASAWIHLNSASVSLEVGESASVPYSIAVPTDASPGSHYAAIFVTREADTLTQSGAGVGFNVVSLIEIRVSGDARVALAIDSFSTDHSVYGDLPVQFAVVLENTGSVHLKPTGIISITDMLGHQVGTVTVNEKGGGVVAHKKSRFETNWQSVPSERSSFLFGRYTAVLSIVYGDSQRGKDTTSWTLTFWIIPWKQVGLVFGVVLTLVIVFIVSIRTYIRRTLQRSGHRVEAHAASSPASFGRRMRSMVLWIALVVALLFIGFVVLSA